MRDILSLKEQKESEKTKSETEGGKHFFSSEERANKLSKTKCVFFLDIMG